MVAVANINMTDTRKFKLKYKYKKVSDKGMHTSTQTKFQIKTYKYRNIFNPRMYIHKQMYKQTNPKKYNMDIVT